MTTSCETSLNAETQTCPLKLGFMSNIKEKQNDRFIDQDKSFVLTSGKKTYSSWLSFRAIDINLTRGNVLNNWFYNH